MKILWIIGESPLPPNSGGKMRTLGLLQALASRHDVTAAVLQPAGAPQGNLAELQRLCGRVVCLPWAGRLQHSALLLGAAQTLFSPHPFSVIKYCGPETEEKLSELLSEDFDLIQCENIGFRRYLSAPARAPRILNTQNIEADIWHQRATLTGNPLLRLYLRSQARKMAAYEKWLMPQYDAVIGVSEADAAALRADYSARQVGIVPNFVDTHHYLPTDNPPTPNLIVFSGAMDYAPNDDAAQYFVRKIWPLIHRRHPAARLVIAGRRPSCALIGLSGLHRTVTVTGTVDDIRPYVLQANVVVVPLRAGGGSRLKILEAMAMGKAIVSTTIGAHGLDLEVGKHLLIADEPQGFAAKVSSLLNSLALVATIGRNARAFASQHHSRRICADRLEAFWQTLVR